MRDGEMGRERRSVRSGGEDGHAESREVGRLREEAEHPPGRLRSRGC